MRQITSYTLAEQFEDFGLWWLPQDESKSFPGRVLYVPGDYIELELYDSAFNIVKSQEFYAEVINGVTNNGYNCTLVDAYSISFSLRSPGLSTLRIRASYLILGQLLKLEEEFAFTSMSCTFKNLDQWINDRPLDIQHLEPHEYDVTYRGPEPRIFHLGSDLGTLSLQYASRMADRGLNSISISAEPALIYRPPDTRPYSEFRKFFFDLQYFLALMMGQQTTITKCLGFWESQKPYEVANVLFVHNSPAIRERHSSKMAIPYHSIQNELASLATTWLHRANLLRPTVDLFFSYLGRSDQYLHSEFLSLVQAIENFHRTVKGGQYTTTEEYAPILEQLRAAIPTNIDSQWRDSLSRSLEFGNEYSLSKRLKDLLRGLTLAERLLVTSDYKDFVNRIVTTRNYLTHYSGHLRARALDNPGMFEVLRQLKTLLAILLLKELGFAEQQLTSAIERSAFH